MRFFAHPAGEIPLWLTKSCLLKPVLTG